LKIAVVWDMTPCGVVELIGAFQRNILPSNVRAKGSVYFFSHLTQAAGSAETSDRLHYHTVVMNSVRSFETSVQF